MASPSVAWSSMAGEMTVGDSFAAERQSAMSTTAFWERNWGSVSNSTSAASGALFAFTALSIFW